MSGYVETLNNGLNNNPNGLTPPTIITEKIIRRYQKQLYNHTWNLQSLESIRTDQQKWNTIPIYSRQSAVIKMIFIHLILEMLLQVTESSYCYINNADDFSAPVYQLLRLRANHIRKLRDNYNVLFDGLLETEMKDVYLNYVYKQPVFTDIKNYIQTYLNTDTISEYNITCQLFNEVIVLVHWIKMLIQSLDIFVHNQMFYCNAIRNVLLKQITINISTLYNIVAHNRNHTNVNDYQEKMVAMWSDSDFIVYSLAHGTLSKTTDV